MSPDISPIRKNLRWLSAIRHISLGGQLAALIIFGVINHIGLPVVILSLILGLYTLIILLTWRRSYWQKPITEREFFFHILVDIVFLSLLFFYSGGPSNPFVSFYLVPISVAAATLPARFAWITAAAALSAYCWLMLFHFPIDALQPSGHQQHMTSPNLHTLGMWVNFTISAALITFFVARMANANRLQSVELAEQREENLRNDQLLAVASLAAGTAHELGTPLNSIKLITEELLCSLQDGDQHIQQDLQLLNQQVDQCKSILQTLVSTAEQTSQQSIKAIAINIYFERLMDRWHLLRPHARFQVDSVETAPDSPQVAFHPSIEQSIINLLNNAADASPEPIKVAITWNQHAASINIFDKGPGIDSSQLDYLAKPFLSEKPDGLGLGLFLSKTSLDRHGGSVTFSLGENGSGTCTQIQLPIQSRPPQELP